ncbi:hypothetical protein DOTSEDRAFT_84740 [Dothistroma septosporum NZE10]|uniref:Cercosporin MFS transporter CTB4 n=1 Tax=Dothistroma septosporum (strain NZE10 / CBS 128990) TaxID=675120 RepID=N1Q0L6_DOTSN|nr:hypothetical protein DOTSEDRAFT_84740 [Dothistroma septosporum NZE10]
MALDEEDSRIMGAEREASPERFEIYAGRSNTRSHDAMSPRERVERRETLSRHLTGASSSSSGSASSGQTIEREEIGVSRIATQPDLERHPTALSRIQTGRSQHSATVGASLKSRTVTRRSKLPLPGFGAGKPYPPSLPDREEYVNWPLRKKIPVAITLGFVTLTAAFGSSIFSTATTAISQQFGFSREVGILGVSLYVLGFATGPIIWAPFSELYGRRTPLLIASFGFSIFNIAVAVGKDSQTIFICRFFAGFCGACPLTVVGAVFADMFSNRHRGIAVAVFSMTVFSGPLLAPFIGGFIIQSYLGWRWTEYITAIMGFFGLGLSLVFLEETYPPVILVNKAADLRRRTKNWGIHAKQEEIEVDLRELVEKNLSRPMRMLFTEPIVLLLSIYMAFIYGLLYLFLTFYPIVFQQLHGMSPGVGGLPFLGIVTGELLAGVYMILLQPGYNKKLAANNNMPIPEWRLPPVIVGGVSFAVGLFWFGWTGYREDIHWIAPTLSGLCSGFGLMSIFLQCLNYLIDAYLMFAASAIAANTFLRSLAGAGFPLFATQMIKGMGIQWAGTLLGCVALICVPMPVLFYLKGAKLREKSHFASAFPVASAAAQDQSESDLENECKTE